MYMEATVLITQIVANGTSTLTRSPDPYPYFNAPQWKEPAADPIAAALKAAGEAASQLHANAIDAARAVLNLLHDLPDPSVAVEDNEITIEWYKDKHHVAVIAVDGESISWAVMAGAANPLKGKGPFNKELPTEAYAAISAAAVG
jgi:hypothetical protein